MLAVLERRQLALPVGAHELEERLIVPHLLDPARHRDEPRLLGGQLAMMPGEDLEALAQRADDQRMRRVEAVLTAAAPTGRRSAAPARHHPSLSDGCFMPSA
jgi:hypothetical protein